MFFSRNRYRRPSQQWKKWIAGLALVGCLGGGAFLFYVGSAPELEERQVAQVDQVMQQPEADLAEHAVEREPAPSRYFGTVSSGETFASIMQEWQSPSEVHAMIEAAAPHYALGRIRKGNPYLIEYTARDFLSFTYEIDADKKLTIRRTENGYAAELVDIPYEIVLEKVEGSISSNLFQTVAELREQPALAIILAEIFAWEINFIRDIRVGDSFSLIVEKRFREGEFTGYGRVLAANFNNQGQTFEAFSYTDKEGNRDYFNSQGESVKRAFLKAPLSFTRISSGYTGRRLHPVHQVWRAHPAIDYAAPTGTPVKAVGNGVVTFAGWGGGAGNYIAVKHNNGYETMYLHLSRFAGVAKKGNRVKQGEIIGYVGMTGTATGPHLDFRMKKNGSYVNPLKELAPRSEPVGKDELPEFLRQTGLLRACLDGSSSLDTYATAMAKD